MTTIAPLIESATKVSITSFRRCNIFGQLGARRADFCALLSSGEGDSILTFVLT